MGFYGFRPDRSILMNETKDFYKYKWIQKKGKEIVIVINGLFVFYGNVKWKSLFILNYNKPTET